jgi:hypothetical protein
MLQKAVISQKIKMRLVMIGENNQDFNFLTKKKAPQN